MNHSEAIIIMRQVRGAFVANGDTHDQIALAIRVLEGGAAVDTVAGPDPRMQAERARIVAGEKCIDTAAAPEPGLNKPSPPVAMPPVVGEREPTNPMTGPELEQRLKRNHVRAS